MRAVFLDRDGVLNRNVFYPDTGAWESPRWPHEFMPVPGVLPALRELCAAGFRLFLVSNQPNIVNGKSNRQALDAIHGMLVAHLRSGGVTLDDAFYCTHHPRFSGPCACRKPSPYFLKQAALLRGLELTACWMVGDRATDMECGRAAGCRTAWIRTGQERDEPLLGTVDVYAASLTEAARAILCAPLSQS